MSESINQILRFDKALSLLKQQGVFFLQSVFLFSLIGENLDYVKKFPLKVVSNVNAIVHFMHLFEGGHQVADLGLLFFQVKFSAASHVNWFGST